MLEAMIGICLILTIVVGGKVLMLALISMPVIGVFADWNLSMAAPLFFNNIVPENVIYGILAMQTILLPWGALMYGPGIIKKVVIWMRQSKQPT